MKKLVFAYLLLIAIVIGIAVLVKGDITKQLQEKVTPSYAEMGGKRFSLLLAKTDKEKVAGLSNTNSLRQDQGMLFIFSQKGYYPFWMRNMKFPLDIIFIDTNTIVDIFQNLPPASTSSDLSKIPVFRPKKQANFVLEVTAGIAKKNNIKIGDKVSLKIPSK